MGLKGGGRHLNDQDRDYWEIVSQAKDDQDVNSNTAAFVLRAAVALPLQPAPAFSLPGCSKGLKHRFSMTIKMTFAMDIILLITGVQLLICFSRGIWRDRLRARHLTTACIVTVLTAGCASNYEPKPDLESIETIGVVLPDESSESLEAGDTIQLYNRTVGEDRLKNSAVGAGSGAAVGTAVGIGTAALTGCALTGPLAPLCWIVFAGGGAVLGGGTGAVAGATIDTQEQVEVAPVHLYEVNKVLPALQRSYFASADLEERVLQLLRQRNPAIRFMPAASDGSRYRLVAKGKLERPYTDVNLVLSDLRVQFAGKAENDPKIALTVHTQWALKRYDSSANLNSNWDVLTGDYQSKKHRLSEWLDDDGSLLMSEVDRGLDESLTHAFTSLGAETEEERWAHAFSDDAF
jgi:hypothetical protein